MKSRIAVFPIPLIALWALCMAAPSDEEILSKPTVKALAERRIVVGQRKPSQPERLSRFELTAPATVEAGDDLAVVIRALRADGKVAAAWTPEEPLELRLEGGPTNLEVEMVSEGLRRVAPGQWQVAPMGWRQGAKPFVMRVHKAAANLSLRVMEPVSNIVSAPIPLTVTPGTPAFFRLTAGGASMAGESQVFTAFALTKRSNLLEPMHWAEKTAIQVGGLAARVLSNGDTGAVYQVNQTRAGVHDVLAAGPWGRSVAGQLTVLPGAVSNLKVGPLPPALRAGDAFSVPLYGEDAWGNAVPPRTMAEASSIHTNSVNLAVRPPEAMGDPMMLRGEIRLAGEIPLEVQWMDGGRPGPSTRVTAKVTPGPVRQVLVSNTTLRALGSKAEVPARFLDAYGNEASAADVTSLSLTLRGASTNRAIRAKQGSPLGSLVLPGDKAGRFTVESDTGVSLGDVQVYPGPLSTFRFQLKGPPVAGETVRLEIEAFDAFTNRWESILAPDTLSLAIDAPFVAILDGSNLAFAPGTPLVLTQSLSVPFVFMKSGSNRLVVNSGSNQASLGLAVSPGKAAMVLARNWPTSLACGDSNALAFALLDGYSNGVTTPEGLTYGLAFAGQALPSKGRFVRAESGWTLQVEPRAWASNVILSIASTGTVMVTQAFTMAPPVLKTHTFTSRRLDLMAPATNRPPLAGVTRLDQPTDAFGPLSFKVLDARGSGVSLLDGTNLLPLTSNASANIASAQDLRVLASGSGKVRLEAPDGTRLTVQAWDGNAPFMKGVTWIRLPRNPDFQSHAIEEAWQLPKLIQESNRLALAREYNREIDDAPWIHLPLPLTNVRGERCAVWKVAPQDRLADVSRIFWGRYDWERLYVFNRLTMLDSRTWDRIPLLPIAKEILIPLEDVNFIDK